jgi:hypothetical protein
MSNRGSSTNSGNSGNSGPSGPPMTITGEQLGRPGDDRFGG